MALKTNWFYMKAKEYIESDEPVMDAEIANEDVTERFYRELYNHIVNMESININVNGTVRKGKSTVSIAIGKEVQDIMVKLGYTKKKFTIWNIARSQYELSKKIRDPELNNTFIVIDEYDDLEDTGENTTVEQAYLRAFSKIQAGRYIHRAYNSPADQPDPESLIILNVVQPDRDNGRTLCRLYYRIFKGVVWYTQLLGSVWIDVSKVIQTWNKQNLEKMFYTRYNNPSVMDEIKYWQRKDFYVDYMIRKFEKMDMINKHGIYRTKELDYSDIFLEAIDELKPLTKLKGALNNKIIKNTLKIKFREHKIPTSVLGDALMTDRVDASLSLMQQYYDSIKRVRKLKFDLMTNKKVPKRYIEEEIELLQEAIPKLSEQFSKDISALEHLSKVKEMFYKEESNTTEIVKEKVLNK